MELFSKSMKCPKCGFPVLSKHTFCPKCGHALTDEAQQQVEEREESQRKQWEDQFGFENKKQQLNFDQKLIDKDSDVEREIRKDEHQQEMADREAQRNRDQQQYDFELKRAEKAADLDLNQQEKKFDFDLDQKQRDADEERSFRKDEHQQEMADREAQRNRDQQQYDFELKRAEKAADLDLNQQEKKFDFDLEVQKQEKADEHVLRMEEHEMKMASHQQDMADREAQRRMEELKLKGNIAMQNMQVMMDAKRIARQDEFEAEERRMQTQKEMTAEQIMAAQIREMDAAAQAKFAESFSAGKDAEREREVTKEQARIYEKMMGQMVDLAKTGMQTHADITNERMAEQATHQDSSLNTPIPLNTSWLREHGYEGSFNELAGYLHNLGAEISQDYDNQGNPIILVSGLSQSQVMDVLEKVGVKF